MSRENFGESEGLGAVVECSASTAFLFPFRPLPRWRLQERRMVVTSRVSAGTAGQHTYNESTYVYSNGVRTFKTFE